MSHRREYDREYQRKYRESHPEKMAEYNRTQMERRRARRVVRQGVCARCGKTFEVGIGKRMTKYCSHTCMKREMTLRQMAKERAKREAKANGGEALLPRRSEEVSSSSRRDKSVASPLLKAKVERRDSFGLTREQRLAVIAAQDGDRDALWKASQSWTPAQHKFAKARWESLHPIHKDFSWGRY